MDNKAVSIKLCTLLCGPCQRQIRAVERNCGKAQRVLWVCPILGWFNTRPTRTCAVTNRYFAHIRSAVKLLWPRRFHLSRVSTRRQGKNAAYWVVFTIGKSVNLSVRGSSDNSRRFTPRLSDSLVVDSRNARRCTVVQHQEAATLRKPLARGKLSHVEFTHRSFSPSRHAACVQRFGSSTRSRRLLVRTSVRGAVP